SAPITAIPPYGARPRYFDETGAEALYQKLRAALLPKFASEVISGFRKQGFIARLFRRELSTMQTRCLLWERKSAMWTVMRSETFEVLRDATKNEAIRENAYQMLYWFDYLTGQEKGRGDT